MGLLSKAPRRNDRAIMRMDRKKPRCLSFHPVPRSRRGCLGCSRRRSIQLRATRTPTAFLPLAQADPLAPVQGPLTLQLIMGLAPGPWVARKRRRMSAAEELRRGEKGRRLDKIIQKIHTTMDFLPECQYLGVGRRS